MKFTDQITLRAQGFQRCTKCRLVLPLNKFGKDRHRKTGINTKCKNCNCRYSAKYQIENRPARRLYNRIDRQKKAAHKNLIKRKWRAQHRDHANARQRAYRSLKAQELR